MVTVAVVVSLGEEFVVRAPCTRGDLALDGSPRLVIRPVSMSQILIVPSAPQAATPPAVGAKRHHFTPETCAPGELPASRPVPVSQNEPFRRCSRRQLPAVRAPREPPGPPVLPPRRGPLSSGSFVPRHVPDPDHSRRRCPRPVACSVCHATTDRALAAPAPSRFAGFGREVSSRRTTPSRGGLSPAWKPVGEQFTHTLQAAMFTPSLLSQVHLREVQIPASPSASPSARIL